MSSTGDVNAPETEVSKILSIIGAYRHRSVDVPDLFPEFVPQLREQLLDIVSKKRCVRFVLPAFPFKSPPEDGRRKTLGSLPNKAEELALQLLDGFADSIAEIYEGGAAVVIVSDAAVYGDILRVSDAESFHYLRELKELASSRGLTHLEIKSLGEFANTDSHDFFTLEEYSAYLRRTRDLLDSSSVDLREDVNMQATSNYYDSVLPKSQDPAALKAAMLKRGQAYAAQLKSVSQNAIRLSIHESNNVGKITINLFPASMNPGFITPWHGAVAVLANGSVRIVDATSIDMVKFDSVTDSRGRSWLLREKSYLFNWPSMDLAFEPLYPCGMRVFSQSSHDNYRFEDVDMNCVRRLALATAPLILSGFTMDVKKEVFRRKASELGEIQMWPFGDILEVRENASFNMNNVLTSESMPFHYDGVFKTMKNEETGEWISVPPLFQMFRGTAAKQQVGGLTLFSSSRNLIPLLDSYSISLPELRQLKWKTYTAVNQAFGGHELLLPFIAPHPESGVDTFRFHEPWPASKCIGPTSEPTIVEVPGLSDDDSEVLCGKLTQLLYDRRVGLRHQWCEGDFIFNDNAMTHHTRTAFKSGHRELWRVHVN